MPSSLAYGSVPDLARTSGLECEPEEHPLAAPEWTLPARYVAGLATAALLTLVLAAALA